MVGRHSTVSLLHAQRIAVVALQQRGARGVSLLACGIVAVALIAVIGEIPTRIILKGCALPGAYCVLDVAADSREFLRGDRSRALRYSKKD